MGTMRRETSPRAGPETSPLAGQEANRAGLESMREGPPPGGIAELQKRTQGRQRRPNISHAESASVAVVNGGRSGRVVCPEVVADRQDEWQNGLGFPPSMKMRDALWSAVACLS